MYFRAFDTLTTAGNGLDFTPLLQLIGPSGSKLHSFDCNERGNPPSSHTSVIETYPLRLYKCNSIPNLSLQADLAVDNRQRAAVVLFRTVVSINGAGEWF